MHRTWKLALMTLVVGAVVVAVGGASSSASAGTTHIEFNGGVSVTSPCNGEHVKVTGPTDIGYGENAAGGGTHYAVHLTFKGTGSGDQGNNYRVSFVANGQFDAPSGTNPVGNYFDVPFHAQFVSQGSAPNFAADGVVRVTVKDGAAVSAQITSFSSTKCSG